MEFLKTCSTNAQAIGDYDAIAYQAFSISRDTASPTTLQRDWTSSEDIRHVETELRHAHHLVTQDASRPWLWYFKPVPVDTLGQDSVELPAVEGYNLQREQHGCIKASEMARPPLRPGNPHPFSHPATSASQANAPKSSQSTAARHPQTNQASTDQPQSLDYFVVYELFVSSVTALVTFFMVKTCGLVALNYRTLILKAATSDERRHRLHTANLHWLINIHVQWLSSGTLLVSTSTEQSRTLQCLDSISDSDEKRLIGHCIRVAPNAMLARVSSFEDPLESAMGDAKDDVRRGVKKKRVASLEQSIGRWKSTVKRWLSWRGHSLRGLEQPTAWVRIRIGPVAHLSAVSPGFPSIDRDILWPRALCFVSCYTNAGPLFTEAYGVPSPPTFEDDMQWFEGQNSYGFRDPIDVAQDWFVGKLERDKSLDAQRKAKKAEEDAMRRKDEPTGLFPSSPFTTRNSAYGDLQAVSGVYPTPPDGVAPGAGFSSTDTTHIPGGGTNVILASGGSNPSINLSAPPDHPSTDEQQHPATSPAFPAMEPFQTSGETDDLFEDTEGDGYTGDGIEAVDVAREAIRVA